MEKPMRASNELEVRLSLMPLHELTDATRARYWTCLSPAERVVYDRKRPHRDVADQFLASRVLTKLTLARLTNVDARDIVLRRNRFGKPRLIGPRSARHCHFSVSHTKGLVACAVAENVPIGLDIEYVDAAIDPSVIARSAFSDAELKAIDEHCRYTRLDYAYLNWCFKEAAAKARGTGLLRPLRELSYVPASGFQSDAAGIAASSCRNWSIAKLRLAQPYQGAIVGLTNESRQIKITLDSIYSPSGEKTC